MEKYEGLTDLQTKLNDFFKTQGDLLGYEVSTNENTTPDGVSHELNINVVINFEGIPNKESQRGM